MRIEIAGFRVTHGETVIEAAGINLDLSDDVGDAAFAASETIRSIILPMRVLERGAAASRALPAGGSLLDQVVEAGPATEVIAEKPAPGETKPPPRETSQRKTGPKVAARPTPPQSQPADDEDDEIRIGRLLEQWRDNAKPSEVIEASTILADPNDRQLAFAMIERGDPPGLRWRKPSRWGAAAIVRDGPAPAVVVEPKPSARSRPEPKPAARPAPVAPTPTPSGQRIKATPKRRPGVTPELITAMRDELLELLPDVGEELITQAQFRESEDRRLAAQAAAKGDARFSCHNDMDGHFVIKRVRKRPQDPTTRDPY